MKAKFLVNKKTLMGLTHELYLVDTSATYRGLAINGKVVSTKVEKVENSKSYYLTVEYHQGWGMDSAIEEVVAVHIDADFEFKPSKSENA
jgi:hypothetical protein